MNYKEFTKIIKKKRLELNISSQDMANLLYISVSRYSKYENCHLEMPFDIVCDVIKILNIDLLLLIKKEKPKKTIFFD